MTTPTMLHLPRQVVRPTPQKQEPPCLAEFTPAQLDDALTAAGWPTWTGRAGCPITLAPVPKQGHEQARRLGLAIPSTCLYVWLGPSPMRGDWRELADELRRVAPDVADVVVELGLYCELEHADDAGIVTAYSRYLLGVGVEGL